MSGASLSGFDVCGGNQEWTGWGHKAMVRCRCQQEREATPAPRLGATRHTLPAMERQNHYLKAYRNSISNLLGDGNGNWRNSKHCGKQPYRNLYQSISVITHLSVSSQIRAWVSRRNEQTQSLHAQNGRHILSTWIHNLNPSIVRPLTCPFRSIST